MSSPSSTPEPTTAALERERGREAFGRHAWSAVHRHLSAADREAPLEAEDLERLATAAYLHRRETESADAWTRAHRAQLERGDVRARRALRTPPDARRLVGP